MESELVTNDYDVWVAINTIRLHFRNKRDVHGMLYKSFPLEKFSKAGERFFCQRMVKNYMTLRNIELYVASNMVYNPNIWFHDLESDDCKKRYHEARRNLDAPLYSIGNLMQQYTMQGLLDGGKIPRFVTDLMGGKITPEQICLIEIAQPFITERAALNPCVVTDTICQRLMKYRKFCFLRDAAQRDQIINLINPSSSQ